MSIESVKVEQRGDLVLAHTTISEGTYGQPGYQKSEGWDVFCETCGLAVDTDPFPATFVSESVAREVFNSHTHEEKK